MLAPIFSLSGMGAFKTLILSMASYGLWLDIFAEMSGITPAASFGVLIVGIVFLLRWAKKFIDELRTELKAAQAALIQLHEENSRILIGKLEENNSIVDHNSRVMEDAITMIKETREMMFKTLK
jgi:hypothetical protein